MGYVFDFQDARSYEQKMMQSVNRVAIDVENRLMIELLNPMPGKRVLDIGSGIGMNFKALLDEGLQVTALDASPYMLDISEKKAGNRVDLHRGFAEDVPFDDNTFHYACLTTTLEFVENPRKALEEACRVTTDRLYVSILNRYAIRSLELRIKGVFTKSIYNRARFFSIWELKKMIRDLLGDVPIVWRTACQLPMKIGGAAHKIERFQMVQKCPFGAIVGVVISLTPRFKTRPLPLSIRPKQRPGEAIG